MKKLNTIVDRECLSSDYIESKQNFGQVIDGFNKLKPAVWKTPWFYGPIGMAVVAITISIATFDSHHVMAEEANIIAENTQNSTNNKEVLEQPESSSNDQVVSVSESIAEADPQGVAYNSEVVKEEPLISEPSNLSRNIETPIPENIESGNMPTIESGPVEAPKSTPKKNLFPHIQDYYTGEIPFSILSSGALECNDEVEIVSFKINFNTAEGTESRTVNGNKIPKSVLDNIRIYNMGYMLFITDIKGVNNEGKIFSLTSMNLLATD